MLGDKLRYGFLKSGEEGAELAQAVIKMMVHSDEFKMEDGNQFFEKLVEEFADVQASTAFAWNHAPDNFRIRVLDRTSMKIKRFGERFANSGVE